MTIDFESRIDGVVRAGQRSLQPAELDRLLKGKGENLEERCRLVFQEALYGEITAESLARRERVLEAEDENDGVGEQAANRARSGLQKILIEGSAYFADPGITAAIGAIVTIKIAAHVTRYWDRGMGYLEGVVIPAVECRLPTAVVGAFRRGVDSVRWTYERWPYVLLGLVSSVWVYARYLALESAPTTEEAKKRAESVKKTSEKWHAVASDASSWAVDELIEWMRLQAERVNRSVLGWVDASRQEELEEACQKWIELKLNKASHPHEGSS